MLITFLKENLKNLAKKMVVHGRVGLKKRNEAIAKAKAEKENKDAFKDKPGDHI